PAGKTGGAAGGPPPPIPRLPQPDRECPGHQPRRDRTNEEPPHPHVGLRPVHQTAFTREFIPSSGSIDSGFSMDVRGTADKWRRVSAKASDPLVKRDEVGLYFGHLSFDLFAAPSTVHRQSRPGNLLHD